MAAAAPVAARKLEFYYHPGFRNVRLIALADNEVIAVSPANPNNPPAQRGLFYQTQVPSLGSTTHSLTMEIHSTAASAASKAQAASTFLKKT
jgi:hypothetical protein